MVARPDACDRGSIYESMVARSRGKKRTKVERREDCNPPGLLYEPRKKKEKKGLRPRQIAERKEKNKRKKRSAACYAKSKKKKKLSDPLRKKGETGPERKGITQALSYYHEQEKKKGKNYKGKDTEKKRGVDPEPLARTRKRSRIIVLG